MAKMTKDSKKKKVEAKAPHKHVPLMLVAGVAVLGLLLVGWLAFKDQNSTEDDVVNENLQVKSLDEFSENYNIELSEDILQANEGVTDPTEKAINAIDVGQVSLSKGDREAALQAALYAQSEDPNFAPAYVLQAKVYETLSKWSDSKAAYQKAIDIYRANDDAASAKLYESRIKYVIEGNILTSEQME